MGGGSNLAARPRQGLYAAEIADAGREIDEEPEREIAELALVLETRGCHARQPSGLLTVWPPIRRCSCARRYRKELGLSPDVGGAARGDALVVGLTNTGAAVVPLWPYVVLPLMGRR